jgi:hypothetical protein
LRVGHLYTTSCRNWIYWCKSNSVVSNFACSLIKLIYTYINKFFGVSVRYLNLIIGATHDIIISINKVNFWKGWARFCTTWIFNPWNCPGESSARICKLVKN